MRLDRERFVNPAELVDDLELALAPAASNSAARAPAAASASPQQQACSRKPSKPRKPPRKLRLLPAKKWNWLRISQSAAQASCLCNLERTGRMPVPRQVLAISRKRQFFPTAAASVALLVQLLIAGCAIDFQRQIPSRSRRRIAHRFRGLPL